jgi:hypothetical protein
VVVATWLERRDLDPLMQAMADDLLGRTSVALRRLLDPSAAEAVGPGVASLALLTLLESFTAYFHTSAFVLSRPVVVDTLAYLLTGATGGQKGDGAPSAAPGE